MKDKKVTICRITVNLTKNGFKVKAIEYTGHETKSCYVVSGTGDQVQDRNRHIKKSKMMQLDTGIFMITHSGIHYATWCMPDQIDQAKDMCKKAVINHAKKIREEASALFKYLD